MMRPTTIGGCQGEIKSPPDYNRRVQGEIASPPRFNTHTGFTLIELVVVMALMVLLIGISYPLLEHWTESALRKAGRLVTAEIEHLYERAVVTKQIYRLQFEIGKGRFRQEVLQTVDGAEVFVPVDDGILLPDGVEFLDMVTAQGNKITEGEAAIYFYPIGRQDAAIIHLEKRDGAQAGEVLSLLPHPLTGRVAVSMGNIEYDSTVTATTNVAAGVGTVQTTISSPSAHDSGRPQRNRK
jgi:prepilin-type N-terminal cleavage/methylation domain-containing protein